MKKMKKLVAALLALAMVLALASCGGNPTPGNSGSQNPGSGSQGVTPGGDSNDPGTNPTPSGTLIDPDDASVAAKWTETQTADGWYEVTNPGGATLGYSKDSGLQLIQVDGFAFKDLNRNGKLDPYEDWRNSYEDRARDLANQMSGDEIAPYLTHGGWGTFTTDKAVFASDSNSGYAYITGGGRGGVTRSAGSSTEDNVNHAIWANLIQELCESLDYGIPGIISIDPNTQSGIIECLSLAATFSPEIALEVGKAYSEQYRAMGISMLLGPQIDLMTSPVMDRGDGTYGEDPALVRDITKGFVSGLQSTWNGNTDLGWGADSVVAVMKHYAGAGAAEGGRDDHSALGKYAVFPNNNFEAHIIAFHDGAFDLGYSSTGAAAGVMMNYSVAYSKDGSLGELVGGGFSDFKYDTLFTNWSGFIVSDWGIFPDGGRGGWGMEDYTVPERLAIAIEKGLTQAGGYNDLANMAEAWAIIQDDLGEAAALQLMRDRAYENLLITFELNLFENPYSSTAHVRETCCTVESLAYGLETQLDSIVMLKNNGNVIQQSSGSDKLTVYIPYRYTAATLAQSMGRGAQPANWAPSVNLEIAGKYYNIVTDTVKAPSGEPDANGNATYTENDIQRATAAEIAACDLILVGMTSPKVASTMTTDDDGNDTWYPANLQYEAYTATTAKENSVAGDQIVTTFNDGYTMQTQVVTENRSYKGNSSTRASQYGHLEMLQYAKSVAGNTPVVVLMNMTGGAMVWSEVEPLADAILLGYGVGDEAYVMTAAGLHEPQGLLIAQMPVSMEAVEAQAEDTPRDMECYVDANGNTYDFAFGMNWSGVINDSRVQTYKVPALTECQNIDFHYAS